MSKEKVKKILEKHQKKYGIGTGDEELAKAIIELMLKEYDRGMADASEISTQQAYETGKDAGRAEGAKEHETIT